MIEVFTIFIYLSPMTSSELPVTSEPALPEAAEHDHDHEHEHPHEEGVASGVLKVK